MLILRNERSFHYMTVGNLQASSCSSASVAIAPVVYVLVLQGIHYFEELH
jgi:hypothetical protein